MPEYFFLWFSSQTEGIGLNFFQAGVDVNDIRVLAFCYDFCKQNFKPSSYSVLLLLMEYVPILGFQLYSQTESSSHR